MTAPAPSTHPLVQTWLHRHPEAAAALRDDGRLTLSLADRARMHLQPLPGGSLLMEGRIAALPPAGRTRAERIDTLLRGGAARMATHAQAVAIDAEAETFVLQQTLDDGLSPVAFEQAVEDFMRALVFWKSLEAGR